MHHLYAANEPSEKNGKARILIIEPDGVSRMLMKSILMQSEVYIVEDVEGAEEALKRIKLKNYNLIIAQIRMPDIDGVSMLEKINSLNSKIPVIMITAFGSDLGSRTLELGADDCIYLPFRSEEFSFRVARVLHYHDLKQSRQLLLEQNRELWGRAITDPLTGLYNRQYFNEVFSSEYERARRYRVHLGCVIFDIDLFKKVNDRFGHLAGDQVLIQIGELVREAIRRVDIAARYGGEEFVLILPETDQPGVQLVADRLRQKIESHKFTYDDTEGQHILPTVTISLGAAWFPDDRYQTSTALLRSADDCLLKAKKNGRNRLEIAW